MSQYKSPQQLPHRPTSPAENPQETLRVRNPTVDSHRDPEQAPSLIAELPNKPQTMAPTRTLSTRSNASVNYDAGLSQDPSYLSMLSYSEQDPDQDDRSVREDSNPNLVAATKNCTLSPSNSVIQSDARSVRSMKSVHSVNHIGSVPIGTLGVHNEEPESGDDAVATQSKKKPEFEPLRSGDVVLVAGMPPGSLFAYDTVSFTIQANPQKSKLLKKRPESIAASQAITSFEGIKDIPAGAHFIFAGTSSLINPRTGYWLITQPKGSTEQGHIYVKRWDSTNECLCEEPVKVEVKFQREEIHLVFDKLLPYHLPVQAETSDRDGSLPHVYMTDIWKRLTNCVKGNMLERIIGRPWNDWMVTSEDTMKPTEIIDLEHYNRDRRDDVEIVRKREEQLEAIRKGKFTFLFPRSKRTFDRDIIGRARTEAALDQTSHITAVIEDRCSFQDSDEIIGELQFCYITGMMLGNLDCMEQWGHVLKILFKAYHLAMENPTFVKKLIEAFLAQLVYDDAGFEGSIFDHDDHLRSDLKIILTIFKSRLNEQLLDRGKLLTPEQEAVGKAFEDLETFLWKWDWDLRGNYVKSGLVTLEDGEQVMGEMIDFEAEDERGEYAPVMVELDEDGREKGLVSW
jgi:A1 cistron-splicing factor AAR2